MENTLENKAKLFAQYWGQTVLVWPTSENGINQKVGVTYMSKFGVKNRALELIPIHLISDEDAIEIGKLMGIWNAKEIKESGDEINTQLRNYGEMFTSSIGKHWGAGMSHPFATSSTDILMAYDFLRSKGYALPYNGLSVEEQVSLGWVVLKTK